MTKAHAVVVMMLLGGQLGLSYSVAMRPPLAPAVVPPVRWAYRLEVIPDSAFEATMAALGAEGWGLVSARRANTSVGDAPLVMAYEAIFQRVAR